MLSQEKSPCTSHTEKQLSSTSSRPGLIAPQRNITKKAIAQRQTGTRSERWSIRTSPTSLHRKTIPSLEG